METWKSETIRETAYAFTGGDEMIMSREEQYEWLTFLIKASNKEIEDHIKRIPRKATAVMRFDFLGSCDCSYNVKLFTGKKEGKDLRLLQRCVRYGLCPHILLLRLGYSEDNPLFYTGRLFKQLYSNKDLDTTERSTPNYSGLYWIHVAIITGKFDAVAELFSFLNVPNKFPRGFSYTLNLRLSPLHLALRHNAFSLIEPLIRLDPYLLYDSIKLKKEVCSRPGSACIFITEFLVLQNNVLALEIILPLFAKFGNLFWNRWKQFYNALYTSILIAKNKPEREQGKSMDKSVQVNDIDCLKVLCEYVCVNSLTLTKCLERAISEDNTDMCDILVTNMRKSSKAAKSVNSNGDILFKAILRRKTKIVFLLLKNKFPSVSENDGRNLLKWAEILKLPEICDMLNAAGCKRELTDQSFCPIRTVIQWSINTLENIKVLIEESGFDPNGEFIAHYTRTFPPVYYALLLKQFRVVEYLLLNGASLKVDKMTQDIFIKTFLRRGCDSWNRFILILVETNAQFLVNVNKTVLFDIIYQNPILFDILYKISHTIPRSFMQNLEEFCVKCDKSNPTLSPQNNRLNFIGKEIKKVYLYNPIKLQMACRNTFRRHCGLKFSAIISSLVDSVPSRIIKFLKFEDVICEISELPSHSLRLFYSTQ